MDRQVHFLNSLFLANNNPDQLQQQQIPEEYSNFPSHIMSCPDLDSLDHLFSRMNSSNRQPFQPSTTTTANTNLALEAQENYMVNFDIYGREIIDSPRGTIENHIEGRPSIEGSNINLEEEERDVVEFNVDKENLGFFEDFVPRRRAQSDQLSMLSTNSGRSNQVRRAPLMDITPASSKKLITGSPGNKRAQMQFAKSPVIEPSFGRAFQMPTTGMR